MNINYPTWRTNTHYPLQELVNLLFCRGWLKCVFFPLWQSKSKSSKYSMMIISQQVFLVKLVDKWSLPDKWTHAFKTRWSFQHGRALCAALSCACNCMHACKMGACMFLQKLSCLVQPLPNLMNVIKSQPRI